jgi:hypothetical protein
MCGDSEFEEAETVVLDDGSPGQRFVTIINFCEDDDEDDGWYERNLMVTVQDQYHQTFKVSIFRLSKPF